MSFNKSLYLVSSRVHEYCRNVTFICDFLWFPREQQTEDGSDGWTSQPSGRIASKSFRSTASRLKTFSAPHLFPSCPPHLIFYVACYSPIQTSIPLTALTFLLLRSIHRENKGKNSIGSRLSSLSYLDDDEDVFEKPAVRAPTRTLPARSYTIDTPSYSSEPSKPSRKAEEPPAASPPTRRSPLPPTSQETVDSPVVRNSVTTVTPANHSSHSQAPAPLQKSPAVTNTGQATRDVDPTSSTSTSTQKEPKPRLSLLGAQTEVEAHSFGSMNRQQPQFSSMEPKPPGVSRVSASLPRSYQRSDSARLTSVVAPRPFGTQASHISSLSRAYTENFCEMRISLNQKPSSSRDFGFQAAWDSTGARVRDEVLTVNGLPVEQMSYEQWKSSLAEALQKGSLVMDVRRHGLNNPCSCNHSSFIKPLVVGPRRRAQETGEMAEGARAPPTGM
ncbi:hypothetical protein GOODEAATRI_009534 [Goodea atripinnis]|uniref:PDZ domain-containing protein n=1 Tax=Goodea atripinnis TaxID=208336 RepID=A0ABV0P557_9TELE